MIITIIIIIIIIIIMTTMLKGINWLSHFFLLGPFKLSVYEKKIELRQMYFAHNFPLW